LEDPEIECFAPFGDDLDFSKLLQQVETMHELSMEDPEIECFAQCGGDMVISAECCTFKPLYSHMLTP
jgi:hypothetical protein